MYLEKVGIHGFKSFDETIKLDIPQGITAIIGPNGSGKSNIAEAIRWVLGEQSAKSLRASKMEDLIFAGTQEKRPLSFAEVSLTIQNEDSVPIAFKTIVIKRRIYRSNESEYFLNGASCRLKDIQEIFMDTGIGKDGYSIIGQGQIDKVLSSKPEERRNLFEEATGIYKFKVRRQEAWQKLSKERENLLRVDDIVSEIERTLEPLRVEAEKTKQYLKLQDEIKVLDINLFLNEDTQIKNQIEASKNNLEIVNLQYNKEETRKNNLVVMQENAKNSRIEVQKSIDNLSEKIIQLEKTKEQANSHIQVSKERVCNFEKFLEDIAQVNQNASDNIANLNHQIELSNTKQIALNLEKAAKVKQLEQLEQDFDKFKQEKATKQQQLENIRQAIFDKQREVDILNFDIEKNNALSLQNQNQIDCVLTKENELFCHRGLKDATCSYWAVNHRGSTCSSMKCSNSTAHHTKTLRRKSPLSSFCL
ncbi:MAG: hypothetical protein ATN36_06230 [Epulopiscium sp. Nele67-Bin005]|nr:MAG: hypothetical protein ATN36_06230 [Epulopiscium sp. Nele67-Bin005]